jgi:hypothetical protein
VAREYTVGLTEVDAGRCDRREMDSWPASESLLLKLRYVFGEFSCGNVPDDQFLIEKLVTWLESELINEGTLNFAFCRC